MDSTVACGEVPSRAAIGRTVGCRRHWLLWIVVLVALDTWRAVGAASITGGGVTTSGCDGMRYIYQEIGIAPPEDGNDPVTGVEVGGMLCLPPNTGDPMCCTEAIERRLSKKSRAAFDRVLTDQLSRVSSLLTTRATKFDEFFRDLLETSKKDFHEMFKRTYGVIYEQNSYVFTDLFEKLEKYYARGNIELADAMDNFFATLYQKMFTVLNQQYHFDSKYLECVGEHMKDLKPFGDVPHKLSVQVKRSFVATRAFAQALSVAATVSSKMSSLRPGPACGLALMRMTHCSACRGLPSALKACSNYCINVMKGCLAQHAEVDNDWNHFVDAVDKVTDRLVGPFNIEVVVEPINIKISEAIMNFQEKGYDVSQKVFNGCGKPRLGRRDATELQFQTYKFERKNKGGRKGGGGGGRDREGEDHAGMGDGHRGPTLERLVKDIRQKVKDTKNFWTNLPYQICNDEKVAANPVKEENCWNGSTKAKYEPEITGQGMSNQLNNPEVHVDVDRPSSFINEQLYALKLITAKLKNAYNGHDVEWIDYEESSDGGSGSGSGDGEGEEDEVTDDEDGLVEGSGDNYPDEDSPPHTGFGGRGGIQHSVPGIPPVPPIITEVPIRVDSATHTPSPPTSGAGPRRPPIPSHPTGVPGEVKAYLFPIVVMWFGSLFSDWL
ncbi:glypican-6 [Ischnura elegans]|uniref:glypican-6 n=1 Tax=Ischnura elegans TaxID=197161 RepID=UPI001ED8A22C|nr:glypican-6 [Ischnura elegans]